MGLRRAARAPRRPRATRRSRSGFQDSVVFERSGKPTAIRFAPDGRVFVAEKTGRILVYDDLEDESPNVFDDLRTEVYDNGDRGLLGLALDPEFPAQPYVYALYTYDHVLGEEGPPPQWGAPNDTGDFMPRSPESGADACLVSGRLVRYTAELTGGKAVSAVGGEKP